MGRREVVIYTCDGCGASATFGRVEKVRGFTRVQIKSSDAWLCTICYGAVEWVVRFQGITRPPKIHWAPGGRATLRPGSER